VDPRRSCTVVLVIPWRGFPGRIVVVGLRICLLLFVPSLRSLVCSSFRGLLVRCERYLLRKGQVLGCCLRIRHRLSVLGGLSAFSVRKVTLFSSDPGWPSCGLALGFRGGDKHLVRVVVVVLWGGRRLVLLAFVPCREDPCSWVRGRGTDDCSFVLKATYSLLEVVPEVVGGGALD
jgi:hypothetical protein